MKFNSQEKLELQVIGHPVVKSDARTLVGWVQGFRKEGNKIVVDLKHTNGEERTLTMAYAESTGSSWIECSNSLYLSLRTCQTCTSRCRNKKKEKNVDCPFYVNELTGKIREYEKIDSSLSESLGGN